MPDPILFGQAAAVLFDTPPIFLGAQPGGRLLFTLQRKAALAGRELLLLALQRDQPRVFSGLRRLTRRLLNLVAALASLARAFGFGQQIVGFGKCVGGEPIGAGDLRERDGVARLREIERRPRLERLQLFSTPGSWFIRYVPRLSSSYFASSVSTRPFVRSNNES